jgi:hypothetical protein
MFDIPLNWTGAYINYRYLETDPWILMENKSPENFFNGVTASRFDFTNHKAYVSVDFADVSHDIYLQLRANAGSGRTLYVAPAITERLVGAEFPITVAVSDVADLFAFEFSLSYNSTFLDVLNVVIPPPFIGSVEIGNGYLLVSASLPPSYPPLYGSSSLASIAFNATSHGTCTLHLYNTSLFDSIGGTIPHLTLDGSVTVTIPIHDIAITNVAPYKTVLWQNYSLNINVAVANHGSFTETFNVTVYANMTSVALQAVTLSSGNSTTITFAWNTTDFAKGTYTISAVADNVPSETDITDNTYIDGTITIAMICDLNNDGIVDMQDLGIVGKAFASYPGNSRWNPNADLNDDNFVDMPDLAMVGRNFGKMAP